MSLDYAKTGVSIDAGNTFVENIKPLVKSTFRHGVMGNLGGFGGAFKIPKHYQDPVLISATDGVGTKLRLAIEHNQHHTIGIDLVAMCVNDLITSGAEPLFFLDYLATAKLDLTQAQQIIEGICEGCRQANCSLIGGETAEMPGIYHHQDYDLAGFCVGAVEQQQLIDSSLVEAGQIIIGLASSGIHANGYSLVRRIIDLAKPSEQLDAHKKTLLEPTVIYVKAILQLLKQVKVSALAHITGGGLIENVPRILPSHLAADIDSKRWQRPAIFNWLQQQGQIAEAEMWRVFNQGIGMLVVVKTQDANQAIELLQEHRAKVIGSIITAPSAGSQIIIR